jgi:hypothetical protein
MSRLEQLLVALLTAAALAAVAWLGLQHYGAEQYKAGFAAAVAIGNQERDRVAAINHNVETELRSRLAARDADAYRKEQEYATNLADAQRRVRAGTDRLRCPAASPVQPAAAAGDRSIAGGPEPDRAGAELVPDAAAEVLGDAADAAGLVRKFDRLTERFEACRAVNGK